MTTAAVLNSGVTSLEELVGRLMDALRWETAPAKGSGLARGIHEARRLRKQDHLDGALAILASTDTSESTEAETRWAHSEWLDIVRRRFGDSGGLVYSPGAGQAAALVPKDDSTTLEVVAVLGMGWQTGKLVSRRSLRGLRPLAGGRPWS